MDEGSRLRRTADIAIGAKEWKKEKEKATKITLRAICDEIDHTLEECLTKLAEIIPPTEGYGPNVADTTNVLDEVQMMLTRIQARATSIESQLTRIIERL